MTTTINNNILITDSVKSLRWSDVAQASVILYRTPTTFSILKNRYGAANTIHPITELNEFINSVHEK